MLGEDVDLTRRAEKEDRVEGRGAVGWGWGVEERGARVFEGGGGGRGEVKVEAALLQDRMGRNSATLPEEEGEGRRSEYCAVPSDEVRYRISVLYVRPSTEKVALSCGFGCGWCH